MNSHAETNSPSITDLVKHAIEYPIHTNIIDAYNNIVRYRSFDKDIYHLPFGTIRQSLKDDEVAIELFALPTGNGSMEYVAFSVRNKYGAPHICHLFNEDALDIELKEGEAFTEKSFKSLPKDNQIFFIETHGVVSPHHVKTNYPNALMFACSSYVMEGGVVPEGYEDGLLTTEEIASMDLSSIDLAIISACKSALGDIDWKGVDGLMRSFKTAGINSLVMTTNDAVDYVSGEVWKSFFRNLMQGKSKRESLLNAIKDIRSSHDGFYSSPKYWTPFILIDGID